MPARSPERHSCAESHSGWSHRWQACGRPAPRSKTCWWTGSLEPAACIHNRSLSRIRVHLSTESWMKNWSAQEKKDRRKTCHQMSITKRLHDCSHDAFERYRIVGYEDKLPQLQCNRMVTIGDVMRCHCQQRNV